MIADRLHRFKNAPDTPWISFHRTPATNINVGDRVKNVKISLATPYKKVDIDACHIHDLRHTAASWLVMEGVPLLEVSRLLGHKSITQTERYAHLAPESTRTLIQILEGNPGEASTLSSAHHPLAGNDIHSFLSHRFIRFSSLRLSRGI